MSKKIKCPKCLTMKRKTNYGICQRCLNEIRKHAKEQGKAEERERIKEELRELFDNNMYVGILKLYRWFEKIEKQEKCLNDRT